MKTKLKFLFVLLTMLWWGANFAWGETVTFTTTSSAFTSPLNNITVTFTGGDGAFLTNNQYKFTKGSSVEVASTYYIESIEFNLLETPNAPRYFTATTGTVSYVSNKFTWEGLAKNITFSNDIDNGHDIRITSIVVTYTTTDPSSVSDETVQIYPYTWDFNNTASLWTSSLEQLNLFTDQWNHITENGNNEYRPKADHTNWGYNIDIIKGLRFGNTNINMPCLDYLNGQVYVEANTSIIIPEVKAGQKIIVTGAIYSLTVTSSNATDNGDGSYTCSSNGNVTLTFGQQSWIKTISVLKTDVTLSLRQGSEASKFVGAPGAGLRIQVEPDAARKDELFSVSSNENPSVMTIVPSTSYNGFYRYWITPGEAGTTKAILHYAGDDVYNPTDLEVTLTVVKNNQVLSFGTPTSATITYSDYSGKTGDERYQNVATSNVQEHAGTITYTSSDEHVATVDADGYVNVLNSGTATITATAPGDASYASATASYTLTVNGDITPMMSWDQDLENNTYTLTYGNSYTRTATQTYGGNVTVLYKSSDESKATVSNKGVVTSHTGVGTVTITAYVPGYGRYNPTEISYTVNLAKAEFAFEFRPTSATVNAGCTITPDTNFPTMLLSDISSLTISSSNSNVATVPANMLDAGHAYLYYNAGTGQVQGLKPLITIPSNASAGSTATITMTFTSDKYVTTGGNKATFTVTVANASTCNFSWSGGVNPSYTLCEGDFMYLPEITGNSNGNNSLSNGTTNASTGSSTGIAYVYEIKNGTVTWNNKDYKLGQGVPDIQVLNTDGTATTGAYVFWVTGQGGYTSPDRLMIYGKTAGTYIIRAVDPQISSLYCDATLTVTAKSSLTTAVSAYKKAMSFPYTWDFTKAVGTTLTDNANSLYWEKSGSSYIMKEALSFNYDYADEDGDGSTTKGAEDTYKIMSDGNGHLIPEFYGMTIALGNSTQGSWYSKVGRVRINSSSPYLSILGGSHYIQLPNSPGVTGEHPSSIEPNNYKLFMKLRGNGNKPRIILSGGAAANMKVVTTEGTTLSSTGKDYEHPDGAIMGTVIVSYEVAKNEAIKLGLNNIDVYWIALSTEEKEVYQPGSTTYPSSTYSYSKALDLAKSAEVNEGMTAYYASGFDESTNSVTMSSLSNNVESQKGLLLRFSGRTASGNNPLSCYMIADPENKKTYSEPSNVSTNYLVGTVDAPVTPSRFETISDQKYTNFVLTNVYWRVYDDGETDDGVTVIDNTEISDDWKFVRTAGNVEVGPQKAYLRLPGRLLNLNTSDGSASRAVLNIVFDDDDAETNGIANVKQDNSLNGNDDGWYTLQGVKVKTPTKGGIYIHNGKKIAIK